MESLNPDLQAALTDLSLATGYSIVQVKGQRKFGGPPPGWEGPPPARGSEIFVARIPHHLNEIHLVPVFQQVGRIYELRLMMNFSGFNRGYAFVCYSNPAEAKRAIAQLNLLEILPGKKIAVTISVDNCRLFVGGIPKDIPLEQIREALQQISPGIVSVTAYPNPMEGRMNRGYAFLEFQTHQAAVTARRQLMPIRPILWGSKLIVDWADPESVVDDEQLMSSTTLHVRNLTPRTSDTELRRMFSTVGQTSSCFVTKIRDFAFVYFADRASAQRGLALHGTKLYGTTIEVQWARPGIAKKPEEIPGFSPGSTGIPSSCASPVYSPVNSGAPTVYHSGELRDFPPPNIQHLTQLRDACAALGLGVPTVVIFAIGCSGNMNELRYGAQVSIPNARAPFDSFMCPTLSSTVQEAQACSSRYISRLLDNYPRNGNILMPHY